MNDTILAGAEYKKDIHHHYMIIKDDEGVDTSSYEIRMILANQIDGLLPCLIQRLDGQTYYYYEITSGQEFTSIYTGQKMQYQELQNLFVSLAQVLKRLHSFLLNPEHLVLDPHFLYCENGTKSWQFCYLQGYSKDIIESIRELMEYLLPKIDHQDRDAVALGYGIYRCSMETHITLEQLEEELYKKEPEENYFEEKKEKSIINPSEEIDLEQEMIRKEALDSLFDEDDWEEENWWKRLCNWWKKKKGNKTRETKNKQDFTLPKWMEENDTEEETVCLALPPVMKMGKRRLCSLRPEQYPDIVLEKDLLFLGKTSGNVDISLPSAAVSRLHARIAVKGNQIIVVDMHSKNGTRINQKLLTADWEYELHSGDKIEFADIGYQCEL